MAAICPKCKNPLQLEQIPVRRDVLMECSSCSVSLKIALTVTLEEDTPEAAPPAVSEVVGSGPRVITIVEGEASNEMIREILSTNGFSVVSISDAGSCLDRVKEEKPAIVIIDVGIPELMGFQLAEKISEDESLKETGIILLASIHDATKYKREPDSLYGADDYIERHHIQDNLVTKIQKLIKKKRSPATPGPDGNTPEKVDGPSVKMETSTPAPPPVNPEKVQEIEKALNIEQVFDSMLEEERQAESIKPPTPEDVKADPQTTGDSLVEDPAAHEAARRFARIIVSDIALYSQKAIDEIVKGGNVNELLKDEVAEGIKLYEGRIPAEIRSGTDYFNETLRDFIQKKKGMS